MKNRITKAKKFKYKVIYYLILNTKVDEKISLFLTSAKT